MKLHNLLKTEVTGDALLQCGLPARNDCAIVSEVLS